MIIVGLTGGIGSGKSTVASVWESRGACIVKADDLAKELMVSDPELVKQIKKTFGEKAYFENGSLDKVFLAKEAFEKGRVEELNNLVHPAVYKWFEDQKKQEKAKGTKVLVREAALLLDKGKPSDFDVIVVVNADENKRISRVSLRDSSDEKAIKNRMDKQLSPEKMIEMADIVIQNNSDLESLTEKANIVYDKLVLWNQK